MKNNYCTKALFSILCLFLLLAKVSGKESRIVLNMNTEWGFHRGDISGVAQGEFDPRQWTGITLPHIMQLEKKHCGGDIIFDGLGWYRREFTLSPEYKGKKVFVNFEGVMTSCEVFVNGQKVGENHGGYIGLTVDISDYIKWGENNLLAVKVSAQYDPLIPPGKPQGKMDFYYYSGIYRDVTMTITEPLYITDPLLEDEVAGGGVFVTYPSVSKEKATVHVKTHLRNEDICSRKFSLHSRLLDARGKTVVAEVKDMTLAAGKAAYAEADLSVLNPTLWHPYTPNLYELVCEIQENGKVVDRYREQIGIRTIKFDTDKGFFINGEPLYLRGANRHQAFANIGDAAPNSMQERDVLDMKRGGFNAVRAAHYPQDPAFLSACDKYGLLVVECIPGWQFYNNDSTFIKRLYDVDKRMVRRDRNHPSIILWETALNESAYPKEIAKELHRIVHEEYPGDQMYTAGDYFGHADRVDFFDVFYKQVSNFPKDGNVMSNYLEDQIAVKPLLTREWGDGVGIKPRVCIAENEEEQLKQCLGRFEQLNGQGYFDWCMLDANPRMGGHFLWSYNDYTRGAEKETMFCGIVDVNRYPKVSYYMMQSMRDARISQKGLFEGPMIFIASQNSSAEYASSTSGITVFSNCEEVHLYRNGKLIGKQTREEAGKGHTPILAKGGSPYFMFDAGGYEKGGLTAKGFIAGKQVVEHSVRTPEAAHHLQIEYSDEVKPVADGSDLIPVYITIRDRQGTLVNRSDIRVTLEVSGEGSLVGDGIERIGMNPQMVEGGIGYAYIKTTSKKGKITLKASAEGLEGDTKVFKTIAYKGEYVPVLSPVLYGGHEEDGAVVKDTEWENLIQTKQKLQITGVQTSSEQAGYEAAHITDNDDYSWWIAKDKSSQVVVLELPQVEQVFASRIRFQKDSSMYTHKVEISVDGQQWTTLYERACTGWDFKPVSVGKELKYMRITISKCSEGNAGLAEVTLYK